MNNSLGGKLTQNLAPPSYLEYAANMLASLPFRTLSLQERGLLYTMRLECWVNLRLPVTHNELSKVLGLSVEEVAGSLPVLMAFFDLQDGFIICPSLENYREYLVEKRRRQSNGGKIGSSITNRKLKRSLKKSEPIVESTTPSNSQVPDQGSNESLIQPNTVHSNIVNQSQTQSIKKEIVSIDDPWVQEYENASL